MNIINQLAIAAACVLAVCNGQVQSPGRFAPKTTILDFAAHPGAFLVLPQLDNARLVAEEEASQERESLPYRFGEGVAVNIDISRDGYWSIEPEEARKTWRMAVTSPGAHTLSLLFDDFYLPPGAELYVVGKEHTLGAFVGEVNNKKSGRFATAPVAGDALILEYVEPIYVGLADDNRVPRLHVFELVHGFRGMHSKEYGMSGTCNVDVACPEGSRLKQQSKAVAMMVTDNGKRFCTGAMVNNVERDGRQLFLTAGHCIIGTIEYVVLVFNYEARECFSRGDRGKREPPMDLVQGLEVLSRWDQTDFGLLEVVETIPDDYQVYLAGWDRTVKAPSNIACIHHPNGDVKKISLYYGRCRATSWWEKPQNYHWEVPRWSIGVTENGSSGSPMFSPDGLIVGQLHGGQASCLFPDGWDMFGGLAFAYDVSDNPSERLREHINPKDRNVVALKGMALSVARLLKSGTALVGDAVSGDGLVSCLAGNLAGCLVGCLASGLESCLSSDLERHPIAPNSTFLDRLQERLSSALNQ